MFKKPLGGGVIPTPFRTGRVKVTVPDFGH